MATLFPILCFSYVYSYTKLDVRVAFFVYICFSRSDFLNLVYLYGSISFALLSANKYSVLSGVNKRIHMFKLRNPVGKLPVTAPKKLFRKQNFFAHLEIP